MTDTEHRNPNKVCGMAGHPNTKYFAHIFCDTSENQTDTFYISLTSDSSDSQVCSLLSGFIKNERLLWILYRTDTWWNNPTQRFCGTDASQICLPRWCIRYTPWEVNGFNPNSIDPDLATEPRGSSRSRQRAWEECWCSSVESAGKNVTLEVQTLRVCVCVCVCVHARARASNPPQTLVVSSLFLSWSATDPFTVLAQLDEAGPAS